MTVDTGQGTSALVAMGDQGVVVVESDATASGISVVGWVHPTPFTKGFSGYRLEMLAAIGAGLLLFWILSAIAVVKTRTARRPKEGNVGLVLGGSFPPSSR